MSALSRGWEALLQTAERRLPALTRHRQAETLPIQLHQRRVYILPTRFGLFFGLIVFTMVIGSLNYNNNPAMLFAFLVVAIGMVSFHHTVGNLRGLSLQSIRAEPVFAGTSIRLKLTFREAEHRPRPGLILELNGAQCRLALDQDSDTETEIELATARRGWFRPGRFRLWTEYPFGIVWAWSYLHPDRSFIVYPKAEIDPPPLPIGNREDHGTRMTSPGEEWQGLREYRSSDPPRHIAWKQSAHADAMLVKEFADPISDAVCLDWDALGALDSEARIARLTAWTLAAQARGLSFRLRLPGQELGPGSGDEFGAKCLTELALLP